MARRSDHTRKELATLILTAARRIVREDGIDALTIRKIASAAGYTAGTIYQHYGNMDDLVHQMNTETLRSLYEECLLVPKTGTPRQQLFDLAKAFVRFGEENKNEWEAVISYRYRAQHEWSPQYDEKLLLLLGLMTDATRSLYPEGGQGGQIDDMMMLWSSMYGIFSLHAAGRLGASVDEMVQRLIDTFIRASE